MHRAALLDQSTHDHGSGAFGEQAQFLKMLVDLGPSGSVSAEPYENGPFEATHPSILVSGHRIVNALRPGMAGMGVRRRRL